MIFFSNSKSQQIYKSLLRWFYGPDYTITKASEITEYPPHKFGLFRSTVGPDVAKNDFMENVISYGEQERLEVERLEQERLEAERLEQERLEAEKQAQQQAQAQQAQEQLLEEQAAARQKRLIKGLLLVVAVILCLIGAILLLMPRRKKKRRRGKYSR